MILKLLKVNKFRKFTYCTSSVNNKKSYSNTIFLPKTKFALRLENKKLVERDEKIRTIAEFDQLYKWQRGHLCEPEFVLHDGPPYANGKLHMGHAINKILKDTILRYHILNGNKVHYVPGWDCHGLPIELKALSEAESDPLKIRSKARNFARNTIDSQKASFQSWGVIGDWINHYATYNPNYVKVQMKIFHRLYKKNLIYRDFKPIYWSPSTSTALAEAELEYNKNHKSISAFVRFKIKHMPNKNCDGLYALIWTTTPWTLPANQAIAYNPTLQYALLKHDKDNTRFIIATDLIDSLSKTLNCNFEFLENLPGDILSKSTYIHPLFKDRELKFLPSSHVTANKGTGLVHTAPAHGPEDFLLALNNKMQINDLVNDFGCYNENAGKDLEGKFVLQEGTDKVLEIIKNDLVFTHDYVHSYYYDWRTKKPVIVKASKQWFIDTNSLKNRAVELLEDVEIIPKTSGKVYKNNLINQIQTRPYWCISRQRKWGVPIPVFLNKSDDSILVNDDMIRHFCEVVDRHGTDFWWKLPKEQLIPKNLQSDQNFDNLEKGQDILDIWFDSGISWAIALDGNKVADMYLEGGDQFTGWFQSSLITSVALRDKSPYKTIYVHGFAVDAKGMKMSKSLGNVIDPEDIVKGTQQKKPHGIDTLRWWVACHANQDSIAHVSENVLQSSANELQKIRSVIRFALGSLYDYPKNTVIKYEDLSLLDKYILHLLHQFHQQSQEALEDYQFHKISLNVTNLLTNAISALYYTEIKDKLYCDSLDSVSRRASQFVLLQIYEIVTQAIGPIVPHMVEEMHLYLPQKTGRTYFTSVHNKPESNWNNLKVEEVVNVILDVKKDINKQAGANTLNSAIKLSFSKAFWKSIEEASRINDLKHDLENIFQVAEVYVCESELLNGNSYKLQIDTSIKFVCDRCRRVQSDCENELCTRCNEVVKNLNDQSAAVIN